MHRSLYDLLIIHKKEIEFIIKIQIKIQTLFSTLKSEILPKSLFNNSEKA
jgi:hypothetical protein